MGHGAARIGVCGLNPHAGESGHLGDENAHHWTCDRATRARRCCGRWPPPAIRCSCQAIWRIYDVVLAMYHDQGLPVLKHAGFRHAVTSRSGCDRRTWSITAPRSTWPHEQRRCRQPPWPRLSLPVGGVAQEPL